MQPKDADGSDIVTGGANALVAPTIDKNFTAVDLLGYGGCEVIVSMGNSGDTLSASVKAEFEIEHSDDNSTWTDCADADVVDTVTGTNTGTIAVVDAPAEDSTIFSTQYVGGKRYVRVVQNVTGTHTNGYAVAVMYRRFRKQYNT